MRTTDNSIHVLLIEDNPGDARLIEEMLRDAKGPKTILEHYSSLTQGLEALSKSTYSLVLLDMSLPDSKGFNTFVKVFSASPQTPIVVLTGTNDVELAVRSVRTGAQDYLIKGQIDSSLLSRSISYAIERAGLLRVVQQELIERKAMEAVLRKTNRALRVLSECNQIVVRAKEEDVLAKKICGAITSIGEYQFAWVASAEPDDGKSIQPIANAGTEDGNSPEEASAWFKRDPDSPLSEALKTGIVFVCDDVTVDKRCSNLRAEADKLGFRSFVILPLLTSGRTLGILQICSREPDRFDREELKLLDELKEDVAYAIVSIRTEKERRRAEQALRVKNWAIESAINSIVTSDMEGNLNYVNPAFLKLWGYNSPAEVLGKPAVEFWQMGEKAAEVMEAVHTKGGWIGELIAKSKDGAFFDVQVAASIVVNDTGQPVCMHASFADITKRKRAEEALRESESRFRALFETSAEGILIAGLETKIFNYANPSMCRMLGYTENELITMSVADIHPKDALQGVIAEFEAQARGEKTLAEGLPCLRKDGAVFYADVNAVKIIIDNKACNAGFFRDITERKKTENDLRLSEEHFRSVWDKSADGMRLTDRKGRLIDVNAAFCKLVRMPREELLGKVLSVAYQREGPDDDLSLYQRRFDARETVSNLFGSATLWNGESVDLHISSSFIETGGQERLLLSLFRDVTEQRKAEKRLEEERNLLRTIIDAIPDEITVKDTERRFVVVNSGTVNALKRASADEIIGKKDEDLVPEHLVKDWSEEENTVLAGGGRTRDRVANKIDPETGEIERSLLVSMIPLKDHEGKIIGLVGINRDITALKQAEELLEKERTLLLTLIENIPDEVCLKDLRHRYLVANSASMKALGVKSLSALIGKTDLDLVSDDLAQEHLAEEDAILQSGEPLINRERIKRDPKTGEIERCLLTTKAPVKDQDGKTIGILVVNRYITERRRMEESLRASEEKFRALFEESMDAVYISSVDGKLVDINRAGIELFGYGSKENYLEMDLISNYVEPGEKERFDRQMEKEGFVKDFELVFRRADGKKLTVLETATAVRDKKGKIVQYRGIIRDVTGQRLLESQFVQAQKMESIGTLAGGIAHDFNNILGIILGHLALLERTRHDEAQFDESIFSINKAVDRGASLVRQILTFARKTEAELEPVNINAATKELAKMLEGTFPKTIAVTLQLDRTIPVVSLDPTQLHQALLNLCVNARDAMEGTGTLTIATRLVLGRDVSSRFPKASANHYVQVSVSDTGCGMDEETKQRIFEPFFTTKAEGKGTGLGLAVVYGVLLAHNGFIDVNTAPGHGTAFHLFFPVPEGILTTSEKETGTQEDLPCGTETILVVEDEDVLRDLLTKILEMQGYTVISASDGEEAVRRFGEHADEIDLVLSDMGLPKRGGWDAFRMMQRVDSSVRALLASGYIEPGQKSEILKSGVKRFIHKPYQVSEVLKAVRETLDEKK